MKIIMLIKSIITKQKYLELHLENNSSFCLTGAGLGK